MKPFISELLTQYDRTHWRSLTKPHLSFEDIQPVLASLAKYSDIELTLIGHSYAGRPVYQLTMGTGKLRIMGWTQMHGDEPTATAAVLDWLHILADGHEQVAPADFLSRCRLCFIVMLNPDGAHAVTRYNAQGIDINRDARALQSPEGALLKQQVIRFAPDIAFNLHDQNPYYRAGTTASKPSTLAFFAPPFDTRHTTDRKRRLAKQLIASMHVMLKEHFNAGIARYVDTFSARCFGDTIAGMCSTILIESGAATDDPCRETARKMNVAALHHAALSLIYCEQLAATEEDYYLIPENVENGMCDLLLRHIQMGASHHRYFADISINNTGHDAIIHDIGDLKESVGFTEKACDGWHLVTDQPFNVTQPLLLTDDSYRKLLSQRYNRFIDSKGLLTLQTSWPVCVTKGLENDASQRLTPCKNTRPTLVLADAARPRLAVIDCTLIAL